MKLMTNVARGLFVLSCCIFVSGTTLNAAKPEKGIEPFKIVDITESLPVAAATEKIMGNGAEKVAAVAAAKKKKEQPPKGVVYLPIVSLSSYVPIGAQILMMLLMIAMSGLFGAWLMFRELAKRVQILQDSMPAVATAAAVAPQYAESTLMEDTLTNEELAFSSPQQPPIHVPVKKRTLFVSRKGAEVKGHQSLVQQFSEAEEPNRLEYTPPKAKNRGKAEKQSEDSKPNRMPKNFLINEWFPVER